MKKRFYLFTILILIFSAGTLQAQEGEEHGEHHGENEEHHKHSIGLFVSHTTIISNGFSDGGRDRFTVPSWGLTYNYHFSEKFSLGLHTDLIMESFFIETEEDNIIERELPVATVLVSGFRIAKNFKFAFGAGVEWEKNENFALFRFGLDYVFPIPSLGMEAGIFADFDVVIDGYDSSAIGIGLVKLF